MDPEQEAPGSKPLHAGQILRGLAGMVFATMLAASPAAAQLREAQWIGNLVTFSPQQNLLAGDNGTVVTRTPSNYSLAHLLIDGNPLSSWYSAQRLSSGQVADLVFRLPRTQAVASVLIQTFSDQPGATAPKEVEVLLARNELSSVFAPAGRFQLAPTGGWQRLTFDPYEASFIKLRIRSSWASETYAIGEVAAFAPGVDVAAAHYNYPAEAFPSVVEETGARPKPEPATPLAEQVEQASSAAEKAQNPKPTGPRKIRGYAEVVNTGLLRINGELIRLYGVRGAYDPHTLKLTQFIRDREVQCQQNKEKSWQCFLEGRNLSEAVLSNGAGWAEDDADSALKASESAARENKMGVWQ